MLVSITELKKPMLFRPPHRTRRNAVVMTAAMLLAGCASMAPPYEAPPLPVAASFDPATASPGQTQVSRAARIGWREYFTDPALQALIEQALANNRDLRIAVLRVEEARAAFAIQRSERWPTLAAQGAGTRSRVPADLSPTGQAAVGSQYQIGVGVASWEIDFWGAVRSRNDAALENHLATDAARRAATLSLVAQVADTWLGLRELDERLALARQTIATREESVRIFSRRVEVGATSRLHLTEVQTLLTQARLLGVQLEQARAALAHGLTLLVGTPVTLAPAQSPLDTREIRTELAAGLPSELLLNRPDIVAAEHQLKAAYANIGAARAAYFPRVALTGSLGSASHELDGLFGSGSQTWSFMPNIALPLFDGGRRDANLAVARTRQALAVSIYDKAIQNAFRDVADALSGRRWLAEQLDLTQTALDVQTERARLSQLRYDSGATSFLEVLDAERSLLTAQQQLVQARRMLMSNQVSLYTALGGGSLTLPPAPVPRGVSTAEGP